jgi:hypothetical protein
VNQKKSVPNEFTEMTLGSRNSYQDESSSSIGVKKHSNQDDSSEEGEGPMQEFEEAVR